MLRGLFYEELARGVNASDAKQVLYTLAGVPAAGNCILLSTEGAPEALKSLRAPVIAVNGEALQGLQEANSSLFKPLTPKSIRAWLRGVEGSHIQACNEELLMYCLQDGARCSEAGPLAEDLANCPLALTADGQVRRFATGSEPASEFLCCESAEEWDLAQHLPGEAVLRPVYKAAATLLQHPQVQRLKLETIAKYGPEASGLSWSQAFWKWFGLESARNPSAKLPDPPGSTDHILHGLRVLHVHSSPWCFWHWG